MVSIRRLMLLLWKGNAQNLEKALSPMLKAKKSLPPVYRVRLLITQVEWMALCQNYAGEC